MQRMIPVAALALAIGVLQSCVGGGPKATRSFEQSLDGISAVTLVTVKSRNGRVEVTTEAGPPSVSARITCSGATQAEADERVAESTIDVVRGVSGGLTIEPIFAGGARNGDGASIVVRVGSAGAVNIATTNGSIGVTGTGGSLDARTSNGSITVTRHAGPVMLRTSNGSVKIIDHDGTADVETSNASIHVGLMPGQSGPLELVTSNGSITTTVGAAFAGRVTMKTSNGKVRVDDPAGLAVRRVEERTHAELVMGDGGVASVLRTSNASVTFNVR